MVRQPENQFRPNLAEAQQFLHLLCGANGTPAIATFQMFDDRKKDDSLKGIMHGALGQLSDELIRRNQRGAGIFAALNETDGKGRRKANITKVRALFLDLDGEPLPDHAEWGPTPPHVIVETSPDRFHCLWLVADCPLEKFGQYQKALAERFNGDPSVSTLERCVRVPGFLHNKNAPFRSHIVEISEAEPYKLASIRSGLRLIPKPPKKQASPSFAAADDGPLVPLGQRHSFLTTQAAKLRNAGLVGESLMSALTAVYQTQCEQTPSMTDNEIRDLCRHFDVKRSAASQYKAKAQSTSQALDICQNALRNMADDPGILAKPETVGALALVRDESPDEWLRIRASLKKVGMLKEAEKLLRKDRLRVVSTDEASEPKKLGEVLSELGIDCPMGCEDLIIPTPFIIDNEGVGKLELNRNETRRVQICPAPVLIAERLKDLASADAWLCLFWYGPHKWNSLQVPRGDARIARRVESLADRGFPVGTPNSRDICEYLCNFEDANEGQIPERKFSSVLGWIKDGGRSSFLWGDKHLTLSGYASDPVFFRGVDGGNEQVASGYHAAGSFDLWRQAITLLEEFPKALVPFYASFTSPLLDLLKQPNIGVDLSSRTSTGKTTALRVAASAWGRPEETAPDSVLRTWDTTPVGIERTCGVARDLPIILDDTKRARPQLVGPTLYAIISGRGRGRGAKDGLRKTDSWRTVLISSGEAPATSYTQDGGTRARILTIKGLPFGRDSEETRPLVDRVNAGVRANHGHAGPMFVQWLLDNQDRWEVFRKRYDEIRDSYAVTSGPGARIADLCATIDLAGELAHEALALPWSFQSPIKDLWHEIEADLGMVHVDVRGLEDAYSWACSNEETFYGRHDILFIRDGSGEPVDSSERAPLRGWSGKWDRGEGWKELCFYPSVLRKALSDMNHEPEAVIAGWRERGWIDAPHKSTPTKPVRLGVELKRMVSIRREAIDEVTGAPKDGEECYIPVTPPDVTRNIP